MAGLLRPLGEVSLQFCRPHNCRAFDHRPIRAKTLGLQRKCLHKSCSDIVHLNNSLFISTLNYRHHRGLITVRALESDTDTPQPSQQRSESFEQWDSLSAKFTGASNIPFLLLQLPQIILNARNILAGNNSALLAVPWLGMLTGLLGNLSLLSYFVKKRENETAIVQTLGVVSIYIVITQLAIARAMPLPHYTATSVLVFSGLIINFLNYNNMLNPAIWRLWEDFITIGGLSALPQLMWSTFIPYVPNTILPGLIAFAGAMLAVIMDTFGKMFMKTALLLFTKCELPHEHTFYQYLGTHGKLSEKGMKFVGSLSGWTATLLFMWMPVAQAWTNILNPDNIKGLSAVSMLLAMIGNGLMIPRALFIRDLMWFTGSTWACLFYGWGNLLCLYCFKSISREFFWAATIGFISWIGMTFGEIQKLMDSLLHSSPSRSCFLVNKGFQVLLFFLSSFIDDDAYWPEML